MHHGEPNLFKAQVSASMQCADHKHLPSCTIDLCSPHALPSRCWAAHTELELLGPIRGPLLCPHCDATKLHHLASMARTTELRDFKSLLLAYQPLLEKYDKYGNSCVHFAAGSGASLAHLEVLACAGAPMKHSNNAGQTFLHVLNTKLYNRDTLAQIIQWALRTEGAMTARDSHKRTAWHSIFQRGITLDAFHSILPDLFRNEDDMMMLDSENHTPLDCLRSYWTTTRQATAIDYLNLLQSSRRLPLYFAVNRTSPLGDAIYEAEKPPKLPIISPSSPDVSRLTIGASMKRHDLKDSTRHDVNGLLSTYVNGGVLDFNTTIPRTRFSSQPAWSARASSLPAKVPEKARRVLIGP